MRYPQRWQGRKALTSKGDVFILATDRGLTVEAAEPDSRQREKRQPESGPVLPVAVLEASIQAVPGPSWRMHCPMGFPARRKVLWLEVVLREQVRKFPLVSSERAE
jgi:hypothetical protein